MHPKDYYDLVLMVDLLIRIKKGHWICSGPCDLIQYLHVTLIKSRRILRWLHSFLTTIGLSFLDYYRNLQGGNE